VKLLWTTCILVAYGAMAMPRTSPAAQNVVISEFLAVNDAGLVDEDGATSDWIEIHNAGTQTVDLAGWYLTDDAAWLTKWRLPSVDLASNAYIVVFASDKNRTNAVSELHTNFKLSGNGEYLALVEPDGSAVAHAYDPAYPEQVADISYGLGVGASNVTPLAEFAPCRALVPTGSLGTAWVQRTGFDDSVWRAGPGGVGYERSSGYDSLIGVDLRDTMDGVNATAYARWPFEIADPSQIVSLTLNVRFDDGFSAYINGVRVASSNAPVSATWNSASTAPHPDIVAVVPEPFRIDDPASVLVAGTNILAMQTLNSSPTSSDCLVLPELTGLSRSGFGGGLPRYFSTPSPGQPNSGDFLEFVADTRFSVDRGFYTNPITVAISCATDGAEIRHTLDGSWPTEIAGAVYSNALVVSNTTVLRAAAFKSGYGPSDVDTQTYIFLDDVIHMTNRPAGYPAQWVTQSGSSTAGDYEMDPDIVDSPVYKDRMQGALLSHPTVSVVTDADDLFDPDTGIYVNSQREGDLWERAVSAEFINFPGADDIQVNAGLRVYGNASRSPTRPKHNMRLVFRSEYGPAKLEFPAFPSSPVRRFNGFMMRGQNGDSWIHPTAGQRADATFIRDQAPRDVQYAMGMPAPAQDHVHLYLNGIYWGFYHSIERIQNDFMVENYGGEEEDYDLYKASPGQGIAVVDGTRDAWDAMHALAEAGVTNEASYQAIQAYLDIGNIIDYMIINFHNGNSDWDRNNWQVARHLTDGSGFKFFVWDSERTVLNLTVDKTGIDNAGMPSRLHNKLSQYPEYRLRFADHVHRHFFNGGIFTPEAYARVWNDRADEIRLPLVAEAARWGDTHRAAAPYTPDNEWETKMAALNATYFPQRTAIVLGQFEARGQYPTVTAPSFSPHGGVFTGRVGVTLSADDPVYFTIDGSDPREYLTGTPAGTLSAGAAVLWESARLRARAYDGANWSALSEAVFLENVPSPLRITEIMYHPHDPRGAETNGGTTAADFEFVELRNTGGGRVGLAGLSFTDGIAFDFTTGRVPALDPGEQVLVVASIAAFTNRYPAWAGMRIAGEFDGQLDDGGEELVLTSEVAGPVLRLEYSPARGWPLRADGAGHSLIPLELVDQLGGTLDYSGHWRASTFRGGSPGQPDPAPFATVVLNEILAHTDLNDANYPGYDSNDGIELYNTTASGIALGGWYLSDDRNDLTKWAVPATNVIPASGWIWFDEITGFHTPITNGFGIDKAGERLFLSHLPGTAEDRVADAVHFEGQENGTAYGRYPDADPRWRAMPPTAGSSNRAGVLDIVVSEIMYHPAPTPLHPEDNTKDEYVELHNPLAVAVPLWTEAGPWRLSGGIDYTFPSNISLSAGGRCLVVPFDPADGGALDAFCAAHGLTGAVAQVFGPYRGKLSNRGERIVLERPQLPDEIGEPLPWTIVDEVIYSDRAPWPEQTDGTGRPLLRRSVTEPGTDPANWKAGLAAHPGTEPNRIAVTSPRDGATLLAPAETVMVAETDGDRVDGVVRQILLRVEGQTICVDTQAPGSCALTMLTNQSRYALSAVLEDDSGVYTSRTVNVLASRVHNGTATNVAATGAEVHGSLSLGGTAEVSLYWGQTPAGTNATAWDTCTSLGARTGDFSVSLAGLTANAAYDYRFSATNMYGGAWAGTTSAFTTAPPSVSIEDASVAEPPGGATGIVFMVSLSASSAIPVSVDFATRDLSALAYADYAATNGTLTFPAGVTSATVAAVVYDDSEDERPQEAFAMRIENPENAVIEDGEATGVIVDHDRDMSQWAYSAVIGFPGYGRDEVLADFPALVVLGTNLSGFSYADCASSTGGDLRFSDARGTALLDHEIEAWDTNGNSYVWLRLPGLVGTGTQVHVFWGNPDEMQSPADTGREVWANDFVGVWHLHADEHSAAPGGYDGTRSGTLDAAGQIARGESFDGTNDYVSFGDIDVLDAPRRLTASIWFKRRPGGATASNHGVNNVLFAQSSAAENDNFEVGTAGANVEIYIDAGASAEDTMRAQAAGIRDNVWYHLALTYDEVLANETRLYVDGMLVREWGEWQGVFDSSAGSPFSIGIARPGSSDWGDFAGLLDEARLSSVARSSNWVWACWMNQGSNHSEFVTYGEAQAIVPDSTTNGTPFAWLDGQGLVTNGYDRADWSDTDRDGLAAWEEYRAGTDPNNPASVLRMLGVDAEGNLSWLAGTNARNRPFHIYRSTDLPGEVAWGAPYVTRPRVHGTNRWTDPGAGGSPKRFYRVGIPE
jgi:hypothetical protein